MLASIVPLVERARNRSWGVTATAYVVGSVLAGSVLGAALGATAGAVLGPSRPGQGLLLAAAAVACAVGCALDLGLGGLAVPTVRRQVNEDWLGRYRGWVCGLGFGVQLGLGVVTIVTTASVYLVFVLAFLSGSWPAGATLGAAFGLARALPLLAMARVETPAQLRAKHRRMQRLAPSATRAAIGVQCAAAVAGVAGAVAVAGVVSP